MLQPSMYSPVRQSPRKYPTQPVLITFAATPTPNWPKVPKLLVETVELRFGIAEPIAAELLNKLEVAPPWNSRMTLAEANGCQTIPPDVTVVPIRTLRRPSVLSMSCTVKTQGGTSPVPTIPVPGTFNGSTRVLDQTIPADGSTNQCLLSF